MPRTKIIEVKETNPYGDEIDESAVENPSITPDYLPGYSEKRIAREQAIAKGERAEQLPYRFHLAHQRKIFSWQQKGYKAVPWDRAHEFGINPEENNGYMKDEKGNVQFGGQTLMVTDAKNAATRWQRNRDANIEQQGRFERMTQEAGEKFASESGTNAQVFSMVEDASATPSKKRR